MLNVISHSTFELQSVLQTCCGNGGSSVQAGRCSDLSKLEGIYLSIRSELQPRAEFIEMIANANLRRGREWSRWPCFAMTQAGQIADVLADPRYRLEDVSI